MFRVLECFFREGFSGVNFLVGLASCLLHSREQVNCIICFYTFSSYWFNNHCLLSNIFKSKERTYKKSNYKHITGIEQQANIKLWNSGLTYLTQNLFFWTSLKVFTQSCVWFSITRFLLSKSPVQVIVSREL